MRKPSQLLTYLKAKVDIQKEYGGFESYIVKEKLKWIPDESGKIVPAKSIFLADPTDVKILLNDYPYGVEEGIVHLVVWCKARIPEDGTGRPTDEARNRIIAYIKATFQDQLGMTPEDILWFKNTFALQSIRSLEHFHVLLNNPPQHKLQEIIGTAGVIV